MSRFSRAALADHVTKRVRAIQHDWGFDPANGTGQIAFIVRARMQSNVISDGIYALPLECHQEEAQRAYGELMELSVLIEEFDLDVSLIPEGLFSEKIAGGFTRYVTESPEQRRNA